VRVKRLNHVVLKPLEKLKRISCEDTSILGEEHTYFMVKFFLPFPPREWLEDVKRLMKGGRGELEEDPWVGVVWGDHEQVKKLSQLPYVKEIWPHALKDGLEREPRGTYSIPWKGQFILYSTASVKEYESYVLKFLESLGGESISFDHGEGSTSAVLFTSPKNGSESLSESAVTTIKSCSWFRTIWFQELPKCG